MRATLALFGKRSPSSIRRLPKSTKAMGKGFYKGTGSGVMGRHTKHGTFLVDWTKVRTYVVPSLEGFDLTPFVTKKMKPTKGHFGKGEHPIMGKVYLDRWKNENGEN